MIGIEHVGSIIANDVSPYIYCIRRAYVLYVGETQRNPIFRWSEHFSENGSFRNAVYRIDSELMVRDFPTQFFAYRCQVIESELSTVEFKRASQHLEHEFHSRIICRGVPGLGLRLISNTKRTAPLGFGYEWLSSHVDNMYEQFVRDLTNG